MPYQNVNTERVFYYFNEICKIPHGSGDMQKIADYCVEFAKEHNLKYVCDGAKNVIIYKPSEKYPSDTVILQGHLDMVCQKTQDTQIDFLKDGIEVFEQDGFLKAKITTLGADNGIAVAMILALLEDDTLKLPSIEAVFTTDEEIGMIGAKQLDTSLLNGKKMINIDSEDDSVLTVSCAGGSDFAVKLPLNRFNMNGTEIKVNFKGLKGGHSGIEIDKKRVNADTFAGRFLNHICKSMEFEIIAINGGDKANAIPNTCEMHLCVKNAKSFKTAAEDYFLVLKSEISGREPDFNPTVEILKSGSYSVLSKQNKENIIAILTTVPNGIIEMSAEIENLVETSLNLGILSTKENEILLQFALRSNKQSALGFLEEKLQSFFKLFDCETNISGQYPTWEFKENSVLQKLYCETYLEVTGENPTVEAIHAGLECAVFASGIKNLDCIAIGPTILDPHTVNERMSAHSANKIYNLLITVLQKLI